MIEHIELGPWRVEVDREATIQAHAAMPSGGADECNCSWCENFAAQRPVPYPPEFLSLLDQLGIDCNKEIEVYELGPSDNGVMYAGWFHFVGHARGEAVQNIDGFTYYLMEGP